MPGPLIAPAGLSVRPAGAEDVPAMAGVFAAAVLTRGRGHYGPRELEAWAGRGTAGRFAAMLTAPAKTLFVAEANGTVVGLSGLEGGEVILVYAAPDAPPGTGSVLLAAVEDLARTRHIPVLTLTSSKNALRFYLGRGYGLVSLAVRELPGGAALPVCLMAKTLLPGDGAQNP